MPTLPTRNLQSNFAEPVQNRFSRLLETSLRAESVPSNRCWIDSSRNRGRFSITEINILSKHLILPSSAQTCSATISRGPPYLHNFVARSGYRAFLDILIQGIGSRGHKYRHPPGPLSTLPDSNDMSFNIHLLLSRSNDR